MNTEKTVTPIQRGVSANMETSEVHVPAGEGDAKTEIGGSEDLGYFFNGTPASKKLLEQFIIKNGLQKEAAAAQGKSYDPKFTARIKGAMTTNVTPARLVAFTIVGLGTYYLAKWALKKLAHYAEWNLFGNVVEPMEELPEQPRRASPPPRRQAPAPAPFQPSAMA